MVTRILFNIVKYEIFVLVQNCMSWMWSL